MQDLDICGQTAASNMFSGPCKRSPSNERYRRWAPDQQGVTLTWSDLNVFVSTPSTNLIPGPPQCKRIIHGGEITFLFLFLLRSFPLSPIFSLMINHQLLHEIPVNCFASREMLQNWLQKTIRTFFRGLIICSKIEIWSCLYPSSGRICTWKTLMKQTFLSSSKSLRSADNEIGT